MKCKKFFLFLGFTEMNISYWNKKVNKPELCVLFQFLPDNLFMFHFIPNFSAISICERR